MIFAPNDFLTVSFWDERLYRTPESRDPTERFLEKVEQAAHNRHAVLDIGAGAGEISRYNLRSPSRKVVGVDLDPRVKVNPNLDVGIVADAINLPFDSNTFDLVFALYVLEHVSYPMVFAREVARVLKPGGIFLALTPNLMHYVTLISRLTPTSFHKTVNRLRGRQCEDTFPTVYGLNTIGALRRAFVQEAGLDEISLESVEVRPNYLAFSLPTFLLGAMYERAVNRYKCLGNLRVNIMCQFSKKR